MKARKFARIQWKGKGGYREVLAIAIPLVLSNGAHTLQQFIDRVFLSWYSPDAVAAALPSAIINWTFLSLFIGMAGYVSTFISQYYGAGMKEKIGHLLWQGIYISLIGGVLMYALIPPAKAFFGFIGHSPEVQVYEVTYFRILSWGSPLVILQAALSSYYSGLGKTWPILVINTTGSIINAVLDYLLIFGNGGFPELGVAGAAIATVIAEAVVVLIYFLVIMSRKHEREHGVRSGLRFEFKLVSQLLKYGLPAGVQFLIDISGFTVFILLIGKLGTTALAATNIAFSVNSLGFMPMIGIGSAVSVLVGRYIGGRDVPSAERTVSSAMRMIFIYMGAIAFMYFFLPRIFMFPYKIQAASGSFNEIEKITTNLLKFIAVYSFFDAFTINYSSAIKGAGDTKFVMVMIAIMSLCILTIPSYLVIVVFRKNIYTAWIVASAYICLLGVAFYLRYRQGKWKGMTVIER
ncbi:MAG: MATE family efflux transporter [Spirochaetales bacterium]|nr:MAG: MATE family efflux transporter [Spirochaetales bacterium]